MASNGKVLAVAAEALFLSNLLILPFLSFLILLMLHYRYSRFAPALATNHLRQSVGASVWAGVLLLPIPLLTLTITGTESPMGWTVSILYFVVCHAALVLAGALGLARAMAGKPYRYPLIGGA